MRNIIRITAFVAILSIAGLFVVVSDVAAVGSLQQCVRGAADGEYVDGLRGNCDPGLVCNFTADLTINPDREERVGICIASLPEGPQAGTDILLIINRIANWVFAIFLGIAIIFIVIAAFEFITGTGEPEKMKSAKQKLIYAVIGIGLALVANGIDDVVRTIINP